MRAIGSVVVGREIHAAYARSFGGVEMNAEYTQEARNCASVLCGSNLVAGLYRGRRMTTGGKQKVLRDLYLRRIGAAYLKGWNVTYLFT